MQELCREASLQDLLLKHSNSTLAAVLSIFDANSIIAALFNKKRLAKGISISFSVRKVCVPFFVIALFFVHASLFAQTVIPATGGTNISADAFATGTFVPLTGPVIQETAPGQLTSGEIRLVAPTGFRWDTGGTAPSINITSSKKQAIQATLVSRSATEIVFQVTGSSVGPPKNNPHTLTFQGLRIGLTQGSPLASGEIRNVGSAAPGGTTNYGILSMTPGADAKIQVENAPDRSGELVGAQELEAGNSITVYANVLDQFGNFKRNENNSVWSLMNVSGLSGSELSSASGSSVVFNATKTGSANIRVNSAGLTAIPSGPVTVTPADATSMTITTQPANTAIAGRFFSRQPVITLFDAFGNIVTDNSFTTVTASVKINSSALQSEMTKTSLKASFGVIDFTNNKLSYTITGDINLSFSAPGLAEVTSNTISVDHATADGLTFKVQPPNGARNAALTPAPQIQIIDEFGNQVDTSGISINLTIASTTADQPSISGNTITSDNLGVAKFSNLSFNKTGTYSLKAGSAMLDSSEVSQSFIIADAGTLTDFVIEAENGGAIDSPNPPEAGTSFNIKITAIDGQGEVLDGNQGRALFNGKVLIRSSGQLLTGADSTANFVNGVLTTHTVNVTTAGEITISATGPENTITGTSDPFRVMPAAAFADRSFFTVSDSSIVANGSSTSTITVTLVDKYGNKLVSGGDNVVITSSGAGSLSGTTDHGDGTYSTVLTAPVNAGTTNITAILNGDTIKNKEGNLQQTIEFTSGPLSAFLIERAGGGLIPQQEAGVSFDIKITALDAFGNVVTGFDGPQATVNIAFNRLPSSGDPVSAAFSNGILASYPVSTTLADSSTIIHIRRTASSETGTSNSFAVNPGPASPITSTITPVQSFLQNNGVDNTAVTVQLKDEFGNALTADGDNITLSTTSGSLSLSSGASTNGRFTSTLTAGIAMATATITAAINGQTIADTASVTITQFNKWTGNAGGNPSNAFDWSNTGNWSLGSLPTTGQVVLIPADIPAYPNIDAGDSVNSIDFLFIEQGATITLSGQSMIINKGISGGGSLFGDNGNFTIKGDVELDNFIAGSSTITFSGNSTQTITGDFTGGIINIQNDVMVKDYFEAFNSLTIDTATTLALEPGSQLNVIGDIVINGSLTGNNSSFRFGGDINGTNISVTNTDIELNGSAHQNINGITSAKNLIINNAAGVTVHNDFTVTDTLTLTRGLLTIGSGYSFVANVKEGDTENIRMLREISGQPGWRLLAPPLASTYSDLLDSTLTQGYPNSTLGNAPADSLQPTVLYYDESYAGTDNQRWRAPDDAANSVTPGRGLFVYFFGDVPGDPRYNNPLPDTLSIQGEEFDGNGTSFTFPVTYTAAADTGWNLVGNPFAATIDWDDGNWTKENMDNVIYVWDPSTNDYLTWNGISGSLGDGLIAPFQAFWVKANGNGTPVLKVNKSSKTTGGTFKGKKEDPAAIEFLLEAGNLDKSTYITLSPDGQTGKDRRDAFRLLPFNTDTYLELYTTFKNGTPLAINNLARDFGKKISIPLYVGGFKDGHVLNGTYTLSWPLFNEVPEAWTMILEDQKTGKKINLRKATFYSFDVSRPKQKGKGIVNSLEDFQLVRPPVSKSKARYDEKPRFLLRIDPGADAAGLPTEYSLGLNYPNPFTGATTIPYATPLEGKVQIFIYDILGRRVKTIVNKHWPAGYHDITWNPAELASGVYIYVMRAGGKQFARKMTYIK
ncbi:MAG TPA: invasin domain 3-containing protein [Balneolaceae bacterium]|nr:invasin domain 3-containing protein [Balneolaceae bacterium]